MFLSDLGTNGFKYALWQVQCIRLAMRLNEQGVTLEQAEEYLRIMRKALARKHGLTCEITAQLFDCSQKTVRNLKAKNHDLTDIALPDSTCPSWRLDAEKVAATTNKEGVGLHEVESFLRFARKVLAKKHSGLTNDKISELFDCSVATVQDLDKEFRIAYMKSPQDDDASPKQRFVRNGEHLLLTFLKRLDRKTNEFSQDDVTRLTGLGYNDAGALICVGLQSGNFEKLGGGKYGVLSRTVAYPKPSTYPEHVNCLRRAIQSFAAHDIVAPAHTFKAGFAAIETLRDRLFSNSNPALTFLSQFDEHQLGVPMGGLITVSTLIGAPDQFTRPSVVAGVLANYPENGAILYPISSNRFHFEGFLSSGWEKLQEILRALAQETCQSTRFEDEKEFYVFTLHAGKTDQ